ncbi:MAG TPA: VanZ family protein [Patescibacteria group bacterium]|jgi:VanZ family protein
MSKTVNSIFKVILAFLPSLIWAGLIYYLSAQQVLPSLILNSWDFIFKKSAHIIVYAILYLLLFRAFSLTTNLRGHARWLVPLLITITYAVLDEFHQLVVPGRTGTLRDVGFDTLGCSLILMKKFGYI